MDRTADRASGHLIFDRPPRVELANASGVRPANDHQARVQCKPCPRGLLGNSEPIGSCYLERLIIGVHLNTITQSQLAHSLERISGARGDVGDAPPQTMQVDRLRDSFEDVQDLLGGIIRVGVNLERLLAMSRQHRDPVEFFLSVF